MFTYLNPDVLARLTKQGKLVRIGLKGDVLTEDAPKQPSIKLLGPVPLPITVRNKTYHTQWYCAVRTKELHEVEQLARDLLETGAQNQFATLASSMAVNSVLVVGDINTWENPLIRIHSNCLTGDVFGSQRCECGPQLEHALEKIGREPQGGMLIYMAGHEGRGIGLWAKAATYLLQDEGEDTYQANESLGLPADSRDFTDATALVWRFIGNKPFRLMSNNPLKTKFLEDSGLTHFTREKHVVGVNETNKRYLRAKQGWGHKFGESDLQ